MHLSTFKGIVYIFTLISFGQAAFSQYIDPEVEWSRRGPLGISSSFNSVVIDKSDPEGKVAWLSTWGGIWKCMDIFADYPHWEQISNHMGDIDIAQNPINPDELYSASSWHLYRSRDHGLSWTEVYALVPAMKLVYSESGRLFRYYAHSNFMKRVYLYDDFSDQFILIYDPQYQSPEDINEPITDLDIDHEGKIYISLRNGKILKSTTQHGGPWFNIMSDDFSSTSGETKLTTMKGPNNEVILAAMNSNNSYPINQRLAWVKKSFDGGQTWENIEVKNDLEEKMETNWTDNQIAFGSNSNHLMVSGKNLATSSDGGLNWRFHEELKYQDFLLFNNEKLITLNHHTNLSVVENPFESAELNTRNIEGDLTSVKVDNFVYFNEFDHEKFLINQEWFTGDSLLQSTGKKYYGDIIPDQNEPDLDIRFEAGRYDVEVDTLRFYNRAGTLHKEHLVKKNFNHSWYEDRTNSFFAIREKDEGNNTTVIERTQILANYELETKRFVIPHYLEWGYSVFPANDTVIYISGGNYQKEFMKATLKEGAEGIIENRRWLNYKIDDMKISRNDPDLFIFRMGATIHLSVDGGATFSDPKNPDGLQDFDVNPGNFDEVFFASNDSVYFTPNFLSNNESWEAFKDEKIRNVQSTKIWFREADGVLFTIPNSNGLNSAKVYNAPVRDSLFFANYSRRVHYGEKVKASFYRNGAFSKNNAYELWLSDANGDFANAIKIGSSETSPIFGCIPPNLPSGSGYRFRVNSTNPAVPVKYADSEKITVSSSDRHLSGMMTSGINEVKEANTIYSLETVTGSSRSTYKAWNSILLLPDFNALPYIDGSFKAEIVGCEN